MSLPTKVYYVETEKYEGERTPYYGLSTKRLYRSLGHVKQFINSHPQRKYIVWETEVDWKEIANGI